MHLLIWTSSRQTKSALIRAMEEADTWWADTDVRCLHQADAAKVFRYVTMETYPEDHQDATKAGKRKRAVPPLEHVWTYGEFHFAAGRPQKLTGLVDLVKSGKVSTLRDLLDTVTHPDDLKALVYSHSFMSKVLPSYAPKRTGTDFTVLVLVGDPRTGKSYYINHLSGYANVVKWNYGKFQREEIAKADLIYLPEFCGQVQPDVIKELLDPHPMAVETKGGFVNITAMAVAIDSNFEPEDWWPQLKASEPQKWERHMQAIRARLALKRDGGYRVEVDYRTPFLRWKREQALERRLTETPLRSVNQVLTTRRVDAQPM